MNDTELTRCGALDAALRKLDWSQQRLVKATGLSASVIGRIINNKRYPTEDQANVIQTVLGAHGIYIDPLTEWPAVFEGMRCGGKLGMTHTIDPVPSMTLIDYYRQLDPYSSAEADARIDAALKEREDHEERIREIFYDFFR